MTAIADEIEKRIGGLQSTVEEIIQVSAQSAARCSSLESEKTKLMKDKEALQAELEREKGNGADHRTVIHNLQEMLDSLQRQRKDMMLETDKDLTAQGEVMRMKYEIEILSSKIKSLERELSGSRIELEQLRMANQQLRRELAIRRK